MSYCALVAFKADKTTDTTEFRNAYGGAYRIWQALYDRHLKDPVKPHEYVLSPDVSRRLWALADDLTLPRYARSVLTATFDHALVFQKDFLEFRADLLAFDAAYPTPPDAVNHLPAWAEAFAHAFDLGDRVAVGFHGTSVVEDLWVVRTENPIRYVAVRYTLTPEDDFRVAYVPAEECGERRTPETVKAAFVRVTGLDAETVRHIDAENECLATGEPYEDYTYADYDPETGDEHFDVYEHLDRPIAVVPGKESEA